MDALGKPNAETRRCAFCGQHMAADLKQCPFCREVVPQVKLSRRTGLNGRRQIRRGLLYMLLGAVIHYLASGYGGPIHLPFSPPVLSLITQYLTPVLFLGGLGLTAYGLILSAKS
jgi:hypothetical protein